MIIFNEVSEEAALRISNFLEINNLKFKDYIIGTDTELDMSLHMIKIMSEDVILTTFHGCTTLAYKVDNVRAINSEFHKVEVF